MRTAKVIAALLLIFVGNRAPAADVCIRAGATGNGTGANWDDALTTMPSSWTRGNTYYIADGLYTGDRTLNTAASGTQFITIKYATPADHGTDTSWSDSYSVTNALIDGQNIFISPYWIVDGSRGSNRTNFGFRFTRSASRTAVGDTPPYPINIGTSNVFLGNIEVFGYPAGTDYYSMGTPGNPPTGFVSLVVFGYGSEVGAYSAITNSYVHDTFGTLIWPRPGAHHLLIDNNILERNRDSTAFNHSAPIVLRNSDNNITVSRNLIVDGEGSASAIDCVYQNGPPPEYVSNIVIYANSIYRTGTWDYEGAPDCIVFNSDINNPIWYKDIWIYNNTFYRTRSGIGVYLNGDLISVYGTNGHFNFYLHNNLFADDNFNAGDTSPQRKIYIGVSAVQNWQVDYNFYYAGFAQGGAVTNLTWTTGAHENPFIPYGGWSWFYTSATNNFGGWVNPTAFDFRLLNTNLNYPALDFGTNIIDRNGLSLRGVVGANGIAAAGSGDTTAPTIAIQLPTISPAWSTNVLATAISGIAADETALSSVTWVNDRGGSGTATGTDTWSISSVTLQLGVNVITVTAHDSSGNVASDVITITVSDTVAPSVAITNPNGGNDWSTNAAVITITGTSSDDIGPVALYWTNSLGGGGVPSGTSTWTISSASLVPGTNIISVRATDSAGNTNYDSQTIVYSPIDTTFPTVTITSPSTTGFYSTSSKTVNIYGTASDNVSVIAVYVVGAFADGSSTNATATGTIAWSAPGIQLAPGVNTIQISAQDSSFNISHAFIQITYTPADTNVPTVNITSPTASPTYSTASASINLSGNASDNISVSNVVWSNNRGGSGAATGTTSWSINSIALQAGANVLTVTAVDPSGNQGADIITVTYTPPDTTPPVTTITSPTSSPSYSTSNPLITVGGTASDANGITSVTWSNHRGGSGTALGGTSWSAVNIPLQSGVNIITIIARDPSGNQGPDAISVTYTPPTPSTNAFFLFRQTN